MRTPAFVVLTGLVLGFACGYPAARANEAAVGVEVEFADSATGYSLQPDEVVAHPHRDGAIEQRFGRAHTGADGRVKMQLERCRHTVSASLPSYHPLSGEVQVRENFGYKVRFLLDPLEKPRELQADNIAARQRDDATLFQGFVVSDQTGQPLHGVRIKSTPSGVSTVTDERGYYQIYVPLQSPASLVVDKGGYRTEERQYLELSPRGDWTYNFRLERGNGTQTRDERSRLRRAIEQDPSEEVIAPTAPLTEAVTRLVTPKSTLPANATIRVPRNIRVEDGTNLYYVTMNFYEKHVLPHEWIASWNTNSLNAGTV
ncbi:MAG: carboxypeptidase-like regulatory domain-containing protein, partial [Limisphaerales bacterium]